MIGNSTLWNFKNNTKTKEKKNAEKRPDWIIPAVSGFMAHCVRTGRLKQHPQEQDPKKKEINNGPNFNRIWNCLDFFNTDCYDCRHNCAGRNRLHQTSQLDPGQFHLTITPDSAESGVLACCTKVRRTVGVHRRRPERDPARMKDFYRRLFRHILQIS